MKKIGILLRPDKTFNKNDVYVVNKKLLDVLNKYDVNFLFIVPPSGYEYYGYNFFSGPKVLEKDLLKILDLIKMCDGIILQGGDEFYDFDIKIINYLYKNDIPTLGICLGMQSMAFYGGSKYYLLNSDNHKNSKHYVNIKKESLLYNILKSGRILVCSRHNFAITNGKFLISSVSDDNIVEAIEDKNKKFFIGLQWHPEAIDDVYQDRIFKSFVDSL